MDNLKEGGAVTFVSTVAMQTLVMNIVMLQLNLIIPVHPFPGAKALVATLVISGASFVTTGFIAAVMGIFIGLIAFWAGLFLFLMNYTVISMCLGALSCYTIFSGVRLLRMTISGNVQDHILFQRPCYHQPKEERRNETSSSNEEEGDSISVVV